MRGLASAARACCGRGMAARGRAAEQRDELASFQLIELHLVPPSQGRIAGYRIGEEQSAGYTRLFRLGRRLHDREDSRL